MAVQNIEKNEKIELVYDHQCPVCRTYCCALRPDDGVELTLTDARRDGALMREVTARGLDIDQGMVLKAGGTIYYGAAAMHEIARRTRQTGVFAAVNRHVFNTARRAAFFYPAGKAARNLLLRLAGIEDIHNLKPANTLKHQLGAEWAALHPRIRERFDREPLPGEMIVYEGAMTEIRRSFMGWLFATFTRVIGNPLTPYAGRDIPMEVALFKRPDKSGVFWQRTYYYPGKAPYTVTSAKRESKAGEMLECVGGGFGMKLRVYAEGGSLHFRSYRYFWSFMKCMIPLPHWITPGETHVVHTDLGGGEFMFTISMIHKNLGETFYQQGIFRRRQS